MQSMDNVTKVFLCYPVVSCEIDSANTKKICLWEKINQF